jgi:hypothetical protein
MGMF